MWVFLGYERLARPVMWVVSDSFYGTSSPASRFWRELLRPYFFKAF